MVRAPITTDDEVHHPVRRKPFHHKGHEAKTPRASWKHPASSHCGKPSLRGITHVRRRGPRRFVGEIDPIPAFLCALRTYPKTVALVQQPIDARVRAGVRGFADKLLEPIRKPGLRLFSNPSMLGCRAGVRGFSDKLSVVNESVPTDLRIGSFLVANMSEEPAARNVMRHRGHQHLEVLPACRQSRIQPSDPLAAIRIVVIGQLSEPAPSTGFPRPSVVKTHRRWRNRFDWLPA